MPAEIRHVIFSSNELTTAVRGYCIGAGLPVPPDGATCTIEEGHKPLVRFAPQTETNGRNASITLSGDDLVAALILYCRRKNIPLPRKGTKRVTTIDERLALVVNIR